jgi:hypothetical protein
MLTSFQKGISIAGSFFDFYGGDWGETFLVQSLQHEGHQHHQALGLHLQLHGLAEVQYSLRQPKRRRLLQPLTGAHWKVYFQSLP